MTSVKDWRTCRTRVPGTSEGEPHLSLCALLWKFEEVFAAGARLNRLEAVAAARD
jgi:hypothetical protein